MSVLNKEEFTRKWLNDNSVKSFVGGSLISTSGDKRYLNRGKNKVKYPAESKPQTQDEIFKELMFDVATARRKDVFEMDIKTVVETCTKLSTKEEKPKVSVNFTFGDLVKRVTEARKMQTIDAETVK